MFQLCRESIRLVLYFQEGSTSIYYQEVIMEINVTSFYIYLIHFTFNIKQDQMSVNAIGSGLRYQILSVLSIFCWSSLFQLSICQSVFCLDRHLLVFCLLVLCQSSVCLLSFFFQLNQLILKLVLDSWSQDLS